MATEIFPKETVIYQGRIGDFIKDNEEETAFIGQVGQGPANELYLIAFNQVFLAVEPQRTWNFNATARVNRFVDIEIHIKERNN